MVVPNAALAVVPDISSNDQRSTPPSPGCRRRLRGGGLGACCDRPEVRGTHAHLVHLLDLAVVGAEAVLLTLDIGDLGVHGSGKAVRRSLVA